MMECGDYTGGGATRGKLEDLKTKPNQTKRELHAWISGIIRIIACAKGHSLERWFSVATMSSLCSSKLYESRLARLRAAIHLPAI